MSEWREEVRRRVASAALPPARENEIVDEIVQHLEDRHAELVAGGATAAEADAALLAELEDNGALAGRLRGVEPRAPRDPVVAGQAPRGLLADLARDGRFAVRALARSPGFTAITLLSLALGIGANTAIFQLLDTLHLRRLPVMRPDELALVKIRDRRWGSGRFNGTHPDLTFHLWQHLHDEQRAFSGMFAFGEQTVNLAPRGEARWARALFMSGGAFSVLGVRPVLGRAFTAAADRRGCTDPGAVVSHRFWQTRLAGDPDAIGRPLTLNGHSVTIIGVAPASFFGMEVGRSFDVAVPLCMEPTLVGERSLLDLSYGWWLSVVGRLKPGWTLERANAHIEAIGPTLLAETVPASYPPESVVKYKEYKLGAFSAARGISSLREDYSHPLYVLLAIAALVLLIACANLANLLLARASAREREIAIRLALGASRGRLVRQLMTESLLIAVAGAALGLLLASILSGLLVAFLSTRGDELFVNLTLDWRVLGFTAGLAATTCLLFGLTPALRASRADVGLVLKAVAGPSTTTGRARLGLRRLLVVVQVGLSFVLLFGALLFVRSLRNLVTVDPGFRDRGVVVLSVDLRPLDLPKERRVAFVHELLERVRATPGVEGAAYAAIVPISGYGWKDEIWPEGSDKTRSVNVRFNRVSPGYFQTMGTPLLVGRDLVPGDDLGAPPVAIINEQVVKKVFGGRNPVGRSLRVEAGPNGDPERAFRIVGIVRDSKYHSLREEYPATVYLAQAQDKDPESQVDLLVRAGLPPAEVTAALRQSLERFSPSLILDFDLLERLVHDSMLQERLMATLAGFFGLLAALLATIGVYGLVSFSVARRVHEIGIRMALGADAGAVSRMVVGEAVKLLGLGIAAGIGLAILGGFAARAMLYRLAPYDPTTVALAVALMAAVAVAASLLPAWRAAHFDPMVALREE